MLTSHSSNRQALAALRSLRENPLRSSVLLFAPLREILRAIKKTLFTQRLSRN
jgi:hypothetical protein